MHSVNVNNNRQFSKVLKNTNNILKLAIYTYVLYLILPIPMFKNNNQ